MSPRKFSYLAPVSMRETEQFSGCTWTKLTE